VLREDKNNNNKKNGFMTYHVSGTGLGAFHILNSHNNPGNSYSLQIVEKNPDLLRCIYLLKVT
jgi:hypothetical protein